jgi:hypothetical protein
MCSLKEQYQNKKVIFVTENKFGYEKNISFKPDVYYNIICYCTR